MSSEILSFYKDKTVFLTGGTGLLGKGAQWTKNKLRKNIISVLAGKISVITEKLLRSTDVKRIYILVRPKRGENVNGRFETWKKDQVGASEGST